ncbi:MAG: mngB 4, partial [Bacteroidetes bacterium]|nr:mngB 4 [Bacteroidota bacterium]
RELAQNESCCDMTVSTAGGSSVVEFVGPSGWDGLDLRLATGTGAVATGRFGGREGSSRAEVRLNANEFAAPLTVTVGSEVLMRLDSLFTATHASMVYPRRLVTHSAPPAGPTGWRLRYEATYHPGLGASLQELARLTGGEGTQHLIVSTHQDIAWMDSPDNCIRDRDEKIITPLLEIMKADPAYHFDIEDVLCLREYVGRHPGRKDEIHRLLKDGRLAVGASFNQPYEDLCSGEMLVRQFIAGRRWLRTEFPGCDTKTYWNPDVPGRTLQMAQVMRRAGVQYLSMSRFSKGLYSWLSPDGSSIVAFSPGHYADFKARVEGTGFEQAAGYVASSAADWLKTTKHVSRDLPLISMSDMSGPDRYDTLLGKWSTLGRIVNTDGSFTPLSLPPIRYSTLQQYLDRIAASQSTLPTINGERPNIWLYIHGPTHHQAISAKREADVLLPAAEIFNTVDALLRGSFASYPQASLTEAWESQLYPDHGWGGKNGEITDSLFRAKYESARDISKGLLGTSLKSISSHIKAAPGSELRVIVYNALSWKRSGPVRVIVYPGLAEAAAGLDLFDGAGTRVPVQLDIRQRHKDGSIASAELLFVATEVPPIGYATYYARGSQTAPPPGKEARGVTSLESKYYQVQLGPGGVKQIVDRELDEPLLDTDRFLGGELFTMQSVGEDAGEWSEPQQPTMEGFDRLGRHPARWRWVESGPVRDVVEARYTLAHATVVQRVILFATIKRVDFEVSLLKWDGTKYREFRLAFPVRADQGRVAYEVPFGTLEVGVNEMKGAAGERYTQEVSRVRPRAIQNWIGLYGSRLGVTLSSSVAVWDYMDPTEPGSQRLMLQPVLLASRRSCHGEGPWYLQKGDHHYRFSLTSHGPGWQSGQHQGVEANAPLTAVSDRPGNPEAHLPESGSFLSLDADNLVLSTMKKCEDDESVIVRLFDAAGKAGSGHLTFFTPVRKAEETSLLEDVVTTVPSEKNRVGVHVGAYEIRTLKITPAK